MEYKGYTGRATFDAEAGVWHGEVTNIRDVVTFEADTEAEIASAFRDSVDDYLAFRASLPAAPAPENAQ